MDVKMWGSLLLCLAPLLGLVLCEVGPIFVRHPEDTMYDVESGRKLVSLECRADGDEPISYRWWFKADGESASAELSSASNARLSLAGGRVTINNPSKTEDLGEYVCEASNNVGTIRSLPAKLSFAFVEAFDPSATAPVELTVGEGYCVDCHPPEHFPAIVVTWTRITTAGTISPISSSSQRIRVMDDGRLCFAYAQQGDEGRYMCHVRSDVATDFGTGEKISPQITVTVVTSSNPSTNTRIDPANAPNDAVAVLNGDVTFECFAFGRIGTSGTPEITWRRSAPAGIAMPTGYSTTDGGEVLVLRNVQPEDAGSYACSAGSVRESATLQVVEPPTWVSKPLGMQKDIYTDLTWTVEASGDEVSYVWYRNGMEVSSTDQRHVFTNAYRTLTIADLMPADTAMYQCFASNVQGMLYSSAQLTVRAFQPEMVKDMVSDQPAPLGATVTVECPVDGAPFPTIEWRHGDEVLVDGAHYNLTSDPPNLVILNVQNSDMGTYRCTATNSYGTAEDVGSLVVKEATMITIPPENSVVQVGDSQILQCEASHDPSLELVYVWEHNGVQIDIKGERERYRMARRSRGDLEIVEATMQDGGNYTCVALTIADSARKAAQVDIAGPPGPPSGLQVTITDRSADLAWSPGSPNNSPILTFTIEGRTNYEDDWTELRNGISINSNIDVGAGMNSVRLTSLEAYSLYTFRVFAVNDIGVGMPSDPVEASEMTAKDRPEAVPENVGGGGGNTGDLRITWDTFPQSEWNSETVSYNVEWRRLQSEVASSGTTDQSDATVFVATENIDLYTQYQVRVQAANDINSGPWSSWVTIYSYQEAPNAAPASVNARGVSSSTIEVTWNGISPSGFQGELEGYKMKYWMEGSDKNSAQMATSEGSGTKTSIPGLEANMAYSLVVLAYSGGGDGPESSQVTATTLKQAPQQKPEDVEATVSGTDITVTWRRITTSPSEEPLQGYKVRYRRAGVFEEDAETINVQGASGTRATIRDLERDTTYLITVQGYSAGGLGRMSDPPVSRTTTKARTGQSSDGSPGGGSVVPSISLALLLLSAFFHTLAHL